MIMRTLVTIVQGSQEDGRVGAEVWVYELARMNALLLRALAATSSC